MFYLSTRSTFLKFLLMTLKWLTMTMNHCTISLMDTPSFILNSLYYEISMWILDALNWFMPARATLSACQMSLALEQLDTFSYSLSQRELDIIQLNLEAITCFFLSSSNYSLLGFKMIIPFLVLLRILNLFSPFPICQYLKFQ